MKDDSQQIMASYQPNASFIVQERTMYCYQKHISVHTLLNLGPPRKKLRKIGQENPVKLQSWFSRLNILQGVCNFSGLRKCLRNASKL